MSTMHYSSAEARSYASRGFFTGSTSFTENGKMAFPQVDRSIKTGRISHRKFIVLADKTRILEFTLTVEALTTPYQVACVATGAQISTILKITPEETVTMKFGPDFLNGRAEMIRLATDEDRKSDLSGRWKIRNDIDLNDRPGLARMAEEQSTVTIISGIRRGVCRVRTRKGVMIVHRALLHRS